MPALRVSRRDAAELALALAGFFIGRASFGGLNPAAPAFAAAYTGEGKWFYIGAGAVFAGLMTNYTPQTPKYLLAVAALGLLNALLTRRLTDRRGILRAALSAAALLAAALALPGALGYGLYFAFITTIECLLSFTLCVVIFTARESMLDKCGSNRDGAAAALALLAVVLAGAAGVRVGPLSLRLALSCLFALAAAYAGGAAMGGSAGLAAGLVVSLCGYETADFPVIMAVVGLAGGVFRPIGKAAVPLALLIGGAVSLFYAGTAYATAEAACSAAFAALAFFALPGGWTARLSRAAVRAEADPAGKGLLIKREAAARLNGLTRAFQALSRKMDGAAAGYANGLAEALAKAAEDMEADLAFQPEQSRELAVELARHNMEVDEVVVLRNRSGRLEARLARRGAFEPGFAERAAGVAGGVLRRVMRAAESGSPGRICLTERQRYCVSYGLSRAAKARDGSGDCHSFLEYRDGCCLIALSDGMGSGPAARRESETALGLAEEFAAAGIQTLASIDLINAALLLRSNPGETFSTLDLCCLDLHTGEADFIKLGAAATFLLTADAAEALTSSALPVGILERAEADVTHRRFKHGDLIVMATDGVTDALGSEAAALSALKACQSKDPQRTADALMAAARKAVVTPIDDMTVLVARVWENRR